MTKVLLVSFLLIGTVHSISETIDRDGESCGSDSIPYRIEVDQTGKPDLYCDIPVCFGDTSDSNERRKRSAKSDGAKELPICSHELLETVCENENEWTSGLKEINNGTHRTLKTECCTYEGMSGARELKTVLLEAGDTFEGGPVRIHGRDKAYDLIKEVRKTVSAENRVQYVISIYRMPCSLPEDDLAPFSRAGFARVKRRMNHRRGMLYDDLYDLPRQKLYDDYDLPPRMMRRMARRRMMRRRPVQDEYYDYDMDYMPVRQMSRKNSGRQAAAAPVALALDDRLWPVNYDASQKNYVQTLPSYPPGLMSVNGGQPLNELPATNEAQPLALPPTQETPMTFESLQPLPSAPSSAVLSNYPTGPLPPVPTYEISPPSPPVNNDGYAQSPYYASPPPRVFNSQPMEHGHHEYNYNPYQGRGGPPTNQGPPFQQVYQGQPGGLNGLFGDMQCFSGDMEVETSMGTKKMRDLKTGDEVLSIEENMISFSPIIMFLHRDESQRAQFNIITTSTGEVIKLTDEHLIYVTDCDPNSPLEPIRAKDVRVGHCLTSVIPPSKSSLRISIVTNVTKMHEDGIYAPLTSTGDIIVNDVLSSCHSNLAVKTLQQSFFSIYRSVSSTLAHIVPSSFIPTTDHHDIPFGVSYLSTALDLFVPKAIFV